MDRLSSLLPAALRRRGLGEQGAAALLVHRASGWIAEHVPALQGAAVPKRLTDSVLTIECQNPVALHEMQACTQRLLEHLQATGEKGVRSIRLVRA